MLYRYWFFGWLFQDASRGGLVERAAALRHNRENAVWLPLYMRRWAKLCVFLYLLGFALELAGFTIASSLPFSMACVAVAVLGVASASWLLLSDRGLSKKFTSGDHG